MSQRIRRNRSFLGLLANRSTPRQQFISLIKTATKDQIRSLYECILNLLHRAVPLSRYELNRVQNFKTFLYKLIDNKISDARKKRMIIQKGGFFPAIIGPILAAIAGSVAGSVAQKYV